MCGIKLSTPLVKNNAFIVELTSDSTLFNSKSIRPSYSLLPNSFCQEVTKISLLLFNNEIRRNFFKNLQTTLSANPPSIGNLVIFFGFSLPVTRTLKKLVEEINNLFFSHCNFNHWPIMHLSSRIFIFSNSDTPLSVNNPSNISKNVFYHTPIITPLTKGGY